MFDYIAYLRRTIVDKVFGLFGVDVAYTARGMIAELFRTHVVNGEEAVDITYAIFSRTGCGYLILIYGTAHDVQILTYTGGILSQFVEIFGSECPVFLTESIVEIVVLKYVLFTLFGRCAVFLELRRAVILSRRHSCDNRESSGQ